MRICEYKWTKPMIEPNHIDISPLERALTRLEEGLATYLAQPGSDLLLDGLIQRFEFIYELSHKSLRRYLMAASAEPEQVAALTFQDLIRLANDKGLVLGDWPAWRDWRSLRGKSSHTYDQQAALEIAGHIPGFIEEARFLRDRLAERLS